MNYLDEPEDFLPDLEEERPFVGPRPPRKPFNLASLRAAAAGSPELSEAPAVTMLPTAEPPTELRRIIEQRTPRASELGEQPDARNYREALAGEAKVKGERPQEQAPKWWQRLAAGAAGGLAGYVNASGRTHVDPTAAIGGIYGAEGKQRRLSDWLQKVEGAEAKTGAAKGTLDAWRQGRNLDRQESLADSQIEENQAQAEQRRAAANAPPKEDIREVGGSLVRVRPGGKAEEIYAGKPELKSLEQMAVGVIADNTLTPEQKKQKLDAIGGAHNTLHPSAPIHGFETDAKGNTTLVVVDPKNPATPQKIPLGAIGKPQQPTVAMMANSDESKERRERIAQAIASGDLTRIKDITSMRGDAREILFDRIRQINPKFNNAEMDRQIKAEEYWANGKGADQLQSFGTFLEHAGTAVDAIGQIQQTNSALLNKPLNWLRANAQSSPEYRAALGAIEPVKKEFESFLLNNRALYAEDRASADKILNENLPLKDFLAAIQQMGHTVQARYNEGDQRYRNVRRRKLQDSFPLSDEALAGAKRIGVNLGTGAGQQSAAPTVGETEEHNGDTYRFDGTQWVKQAKQNGR